MFGNLSLNFSFSSFFRVDGFT